MVTKKPDPNCDALLLQELKLGGVPVLRVRSAIANARRSCGAGYEAFVAAMVE
jgi:hypothetical protein